MPAPTPQTFTKVCEACGIIFERKRHADNRLENSVAWAARRACSQPCGNELRKRTYASRREDQLAVYEHDPCPECGGAVTRRSNESAKRWKVRRTCSPACRSAAMGRGKAARAAPKPRRRRRASLAPEGYVFDGRFPTPAGVTTWQSVSGPDTGVRAVTPNNTVTVGPRTRAMLRAALGHHPDLGTALLGHLTDTWAQEGTATGRP